MMTDTAAWDLVISKEQQGIKLTYTRQTLHASLLEEEVRALADAWVRSLNRVNQDGVYSYTLKRFGE